MMCRYIKADQFIGVTFSKLIEKNIFEIEISKLCSLEKEIDFEIRKSNDAMLCISMNEMYSVVEEYNDFFQVKKNSIVIKDYLQQRIKKERENVMSEFFYYFVEGIPKDIHKTVYGTLESTI